VSFENALFAIICYLLVSTMRWLWWWKCDVVCQVSRLYVECRRIVVQSSLVTECR